MAEAKKTATEPAAKQATATPSVAVQAGGNPAASGNPAVHQLLAERQTAQMNNDTDKMADIDRELAKLGF